MCLSSIVYNCVSSAISFQLISLELIQVETLHQRNCTASAVYNVFVLVCVSMLMVEMLARVRTAYSSKDTQTPWLSNFSLPKFRPKLLKSEGLNQVEFAGMIVSCCQLGDLFMLAKQNTLGRPEGWKGALLILLCTN